MTMVVSNEEAARRAEHTNRWDAGYCQIFTRTMLGAPSVGDVDRDGDADAVDGMKSEPGWAKHVGRDGPRGFPCGFSGGSKGYGHRALLLGGGKVRSTDVTGSRYTPGVVGTTTIADIERVLNVRYEGWSETISGIKIPTGPKPPEVPMPERLAPYKLLEKAGVETFLRVEWGTRYEHEYIERRRTHPMPPAPAPYHFLHLTVTRDTDTVKEGFDGAKQIEGFGYSTPPMVSYQDLVTNEARVFQGQAYGTKGTHTVNDLGVNGFPHDLNLMGYATALMQNEGDEVTDEQVRVVAMIFAAREITGWVRKGAPIFPHRKFSNKRCPGDKAVARLPEIERLKNKFVREGLPDLIEEEPESRGKQIEHAIRDLEAAKGKGDRKERIERALRILKRIEFLDGKKD